jgi:hypothetical protein
MNVTPVVQLAIALSVEEQVLFTKANPGDAAKVRLVRLPAGLGLVTVTVTGLLVAPTLVAGKLTTAGCICAAPGMPPVPLSTTWVGTANAGELTVSMPV